MRDYGTKVFKMVSWKSAFRRIFPMYLFHLALFQGIY